MEPENRLREESSRGAVCSLVTGGLLTQSLWVMASESVLDASTELVLLLSPQFFILPRDPEVMKATGLPFLLPSWQGHPFSEVMLRQVWRTYLALVKEAPRLMLDSNPELKSWSLLGLRALSLMLTFVSLVTEWGMGRHVQKQQQDRPLWESTGRQGWFQGKVMSS